VYCLPGEFQCEFFPVFLSPHSHAQDSTHCDGLIPRGPAAQDYRVPEIYS